MNKSLKFTTLAVLFAILFAFCITASFAQEEATTTETTTTETTTQQQNNVRLIVHKVATPSEAVINSNITFTITVINMGEEPAYDIEVKDNEWPEAQFDVDGETKATFEKVGPNDRVVLKYSIVPKVIGEITTQFALASYRLSPATDKDEKTGLKLFAKSNVLPAIPILTQAEYDRRHDSHYDDWAIFFILSLIPVALPYVVYMYANNQIVELAEQKKSN